MQQWSNHMKEWKEEIKIEVHRWLWNLKVLRINGRVDLMIRGAILSLLCTIFIGIGATSKVSSSVALQESIAKEIIRFHVIANSDSEEDQQVKLKVKDAVVAGLKEQMGEARDVDEARKNLVEQMSFIKSVAQNVLHENGFYYGVEVKLCNRKFPIKTYGDITLPAGVYEALCIELGEVKGQNWWCIMFPSLCFVDTTHAIVPNESKEQLSHILTEEEYDSITVSDEKDGIQIKVRFKLWNYLKKYF